MKAGRTAMRLEVREDNRRAHAWYGRVGYRNIGRVAAYYADGGAALRHDKPLRPAEPLERNFAA